MTSEIKEAIESLEAAIKEGYLHPAVDRQAKHINSLIVLARYFMPEYTAAPSTVVESGAAAKDALVNDAERKYLNEVFDCLPDSMSDFLADFLNRLTPAPAISLTDGGAGSQWISVKERTPDHDGPVLILAYSDDKHTAIWRTVHVAVLAQFGWNDYYDELQAWGEEEVTHWQPLPTAPTSNGN